MLSGQAWFLGAALELAEALAVSQTALEAVTADTDAAVRWQVLLAWGGGPAGRRGRLPGALLRTEDL